ncbi:SDR family NAD(P)-dependent oxidoreductase [Lentzea sp.]|uniref:SDR family NAD(P)-dependent oxidoreductase n=1 Tax=Lentzea sp. TaxID=56099 RepID=UPI002ED2AD83
MTTTLVTGANKGLGLETTRRLVEAGHTVHAGMRDLAGAGPAQALGAIPVQLDVTDSDSVDKAVASLPELDVLVNNAAVVGPSWGLDDLDVEAMRIAFETNVFGIVRLTQAALPLLRRSANPVVVNVASGLDFPRALLDPDDDSFSGLMVPYASSKAAVIALTVQYAKNLPQMRINASDPGYTTTDLNAHQGHQTVTQGTDATVALALLDRNGPTGEFHNRHGRLDY